MASRKYGDWDKVRQILDEATNDIMKAASKAFLQEGHRLRGHMVTGIREQAPGGKAFKPLSPLTLAARRLAGFRGTKALMVHGDLRNSISVSQHGGTTFIGILRTARTGEGKELVNIGIVMEFGAGPYVLQLTPKMKRYLGVLMKEAYGESDIPKPFWLLKANPNPRQSIVVKIPARPFVGPVFEMYAKPEDVKKRVEDKMVELLKGKLSK